MTSISVGSDTSWPSEVVIYTDGASRGNPGPASIGVSVQDASGQVVYEYAQCLGQNTNNVAEYSAVKKALELAVANQVTAVTLRSDSELLIRQLSGVYKVKAPGLIALYQDCRSLAAQLPRLTFEHVRREFNKRADQLANAALDGRQSV